MYYALFYRGCQTSYSRPLILLLKDVLYRRSQQMPGNKVTPFVLKTDSVPLLVIT